MDRSEIKYAVARMGRIIHNEGIGPTADEWNVCRDNNLWPTAQRVYTIVMQQRGPVRESTDSDWAAMLGTMGLQYPEDMTS